MKITKIMNNQIKIKEEENQKMKIEKSIIEWLPIILSKKLKLKFLNI
jgi:hypothetical protein